MKETKVEILLHRQDDTTESLVRWVDEPGDVNFFWLQAQLPKPNSDCDVYVNGERFDVPQTDLAELVRAERKKLRLTQAEFSKKLAVTKTTVNNWERGKSPVPSNMFALMAYLKKS